MTSQRRVRRCAGQAGQQRLGLGVESSERCAAEGLLGREGQCVVVAQRRVVQERGGGGELMAGRGRGVLRAVAFEDAGEHVDRGRRQQALPPDEVVRVAVVGGGEVDVVGGAAAGERDVEELAGLLTGDDGVAGVGGLALRGVDGGGVSELDVLAHVLGGQRHCAAQRQVAGAEAAVRTYGSHGPAVAVLDPVGRGECEATFVATGDDGVANRGAGAVAQQDLTIGCAGALRRESPAGLRGPVR